MEGIKETVVTAGICLIGGFVTRIISRGASDIYTQHKMAKEIDKMIDDKEEK